MLMRKPEVKLRVWCGLAVKYFIFLRVVFMPRKIFLSYIILKYKICTNNFLHTHKIVTSELLITNLNPTRFKGCSLTKENN